MSTYLKFIPVLILTMTLFVGCDFGKAPNMDQVRDTLMAEYGDQVFTEEELYGEAEEEVVVEADESAYSAEDCDAACQAEFENYLQLMCEAEGEQPIYYCENCDEICREEEFQFFMMMRGIFEQPAEGQ